jgi:hypothetical protein
MRRIDIFIWILSREMLNLFSIEDEMSHGSVLTNIDGEKKYITTQLIANTEYDSLKMQMDSFAESILNNTHPEVSVEHGYKALEVAYIISEKIRKRELGVCLEIVKNYYKI